MADNVNDVLQELSILLRRISEQNDASMKRQDERKSEKNERRDLHFHERLIQTLEHQNQLLESLIARLKENPKKG